MIGIIDYGAGNVRSIVNALERIDVRSFASADIDELDSAVGLILPGVGAAGAAMASLRAAGLAVWLPRVRRPLLGICLGMQMLFQRSEEGDTECLGILPGSVRRFRHATLKVPHMGWSPVVRCGDSPLLDGMTDGAFFYFVHAYHAAVDTTTVAATEYGARFAAVVQAGNIFGVQFHPEKSGAAGLRLLENFVRLC